MHVVFVKKQEIPMAEIDPLVGTVGNDNFVVSGGDPFHGKDVSAEGRQLVEETLNVIWGYRKARETRFRVWLQSIDMTC